jgi:hypothetical protein
VRNGISSWTKFTGTDWLIPSNPADELRMLLQTKFHYPKHSKKKKKKNMTAMAVQINQSL